MNNRQERLLRRKPVPSILQFNDFSLQPFHVDDSGVEVMKTPSAQNVKTHSWWTPFYLTRTVLLAFVGVFVSFILTLAALFAYSQNNEGLSTANDQNFYLWTYGPTAVLTFVAAFWGQVIYRTKQLMPWKAMATNVQTASKSVLLDYVSPVSPIAFYAAISNSHYMVSLVIASSLIFTAMTIFSTGLFTLQYANVTAHNVSLVVTNKFDWSNFDWTSLDARPTAVVYAALKLGLEYPEGTTAHYTVQEFTNAQGSNATLNGTVDTFSAYLECEEATLGVTNISEWAPFGHLFHSGALFTVNITTPTCTIANVSFDSGSEFDENTPFNETYYESFGFGRFVDCIEPNEHRVLISAGTFRVIERWNGTEESDAPIALSLPFDKMFHILNSTNILCTPHYRIAKSQVVKRSNATDRDVFESISLNGAGDSQTAMAMDMARGVFQSVNDPTAQNFYSNGSVFPTILDTFFTLMEQERPFFQDVASASEFWLQSQNLVHNANLLYGSVAAQVAAQKLFIPTNESVFGSVTTSEPRLYVRVLSFTLMEACLVMLTSTAALLLFYTSRPLVPHDPCSISGIAAILTKSTELCQMFKERGASSVSELEAQGRRNLYYTGLQSESSQGFAIHTSKCPAKSDDSTMQTDETNPLPVRWWQPLVLSAPARLLVILTPLVFIIILEILFTISRSNNGLLGIDSSSWFHYGWTYIPALAMVCVHILYIAVDFNVRMLSPYATMKGRSAHASISVHDHPLSRIALHELFVAMKRGQFSVLAATLAALLAPLLTIAVSGLYTAEQYYQDVGVRQLTGWNFNNSIETNLTLVQNVFNELNEPNPTNYTSGYGSGTITDLIITANLSYPQWSYNELAFPLVQITSPEGKFANNSTPPRGSLDLSIPAIRGVLNCTVIPTQDVNLTYATYNSSYLSAIYNETERYTMAGNRQCLNYSVEAGTDSGFDQGSTGCRVALFSTSNSYSLGGCTLPPKLLFLPAQTDQLQDFGYLSSYSEAVNHTYCPVYSGMIGSTTSAEVRDYTWFFCSTDVETVTTRTTFTLPEYSISKVQVDETTASKVASHAETTLTNNTGSMIEVNFTGSNAALYSSNGIVDVNNYLTFYNISEGQNYDNFFSALVYGRDGVPASEMIGTANVSRLFSAVQHLWRVIYAQQFRTSEYYLSANPSVLKAWAPQQPLNATLMDSQAYRLKQNAVSTRILQGILGALSLCAIITFLLMDTYAVVPNNPSSIAVVASLLAGSEMLDVLASKENNLSELHKWDGYFFSLGWWRLPGGGKRFGIDIGKAERAS